jgi:protein involved in polysaccharide export with SLBB domain
MINRFFKILYIFVLLILCQPLMAQSVNDLLFQQLLEQNPEIIQDLQNQTQQIEVDRSLASKTQNFVSASQNQQRDLTTSPDMNSLGSQSIITRYYKTLTGEVLTTYGAQEFTQTQDESLLFYNTIGKDYEFAPGDIVQVTITGLSPSTGPVQIAKDGTITINRLYPLHVAGLKVEQISDLILDQILLDDASAKVFVRLDTARLVTVQISGNVNSPRTIAIPPYTPLSRIIAYSGGVSDNGSLRSIHLNNNGEKTKTVDFYEFLKNPESINDPLVVENARIFVPNKGATIAASGFIGQPGIYELPNKTFQISVENFLELTGTNFIPPGAILKALYFDNNGQSVSRIVSKNDLLYQGEALKIEFVETRELNVSKIQGAVLKEYKLSTKEPISIKKVLKGGSVLSQNAFLPFALITGKEIQAINLNEALIDESIILPVGASLKVFTYSEYLSLVSQDPNLTNNPFVSKIYKAKVAEIYLDGKRIAYVPLSSNRNFLESISDFYTPSPKTVYDIALIENNSSVEAFDLRSAIRLDSRGPLLKGDRVFIFENNFYANILDYGRQTSQAKPLELTPSPSAEIYADILQMNNLSDPEITLDEQENRNSEEIDFIRKILQQSNLISVKLDGELFAFLPHAIDTDSNDILKTLRNRLPKLITEFVITNDIATNNIPKIKNLNDPFEIKEGGEINFISNDAYRSLIAKFETNASTGLISDVRYSDAVKVYYNGKLALLLPPNYSPSQLKLFEQYYKKNDFYKLYIGLNTINSNTENWNLLTFGSDSFFSNTSQLLLGPSNIVNLFSNGFIRNKFIEDSENINGVNFNINSTAQIDSVDVDTIIPQVSMINSAITDESLINQIRSMGLQAELDNTTGTDEEIITTQKRFFDYQIEIMRNSLRTISGSVQFPGSYPVADEIRLSNFIATAELIENTAKSDIRITRAIKQQDQLINVEPIILPLDSTKLNEQILSGLYYLEIPLADNNAITGVIELKGEVLNPGNYSFTRSETVQNIIKRAGGLTDVAFPLGAVLKRESAKKLERESNNILADQLEASILNLAQSSLEGAGDQVKVVLGYANQLRLQPTTGRMALNILENNSSAPQFLEDGDILTIPKRPAHISIVGSVQRSTIASYIPGQSFTDYLQMAGGLTKVADSRKAYMLLPNGQSLKLNSSTIIPVGSVIVVPPKLDRLSILGGTDIISKVLSNISNSILSIQNVD